MEHKFNVQFAKDYGIEAAIIINNLYYWIAKNVANDKHYYDGRYWTYNNAKAFATLFPYLNDRKIYRVFNTLKEENFIIYGNYNSNKFDKTNWYAFTDYALSRLAEQNYDITGFSSVCQNGNIELPNLVNRNTKNGNSNIIINNTNIKTNEKKNEIDESISKSSSSRTKYADDFEKAWEMAQRKGSKQEAYKYWKKLNAEEKKLVLAHLPFYYNSNDRQYLKDFSGYLNRRYFTNVVCDRKGNIIYDPERKTTNTYRPLTDGAIRWSDKKNCYIYVNMYFGYIPDGYDDNERPDGATVMLNNSCEIIKWNAENKKWEKVV